MPLDVPQDICDQCKAVKKESNHWWVVSFCASLPDGPPAYAPLFVLMPLDRLIPEHRKIAGANLHVCCSKSCAIQALSAWMDKQTA